MDQFKTLADGTEEIYRFAIAAAWDQHRRYPEFTLPECLAERTMLFSYLKLCSCKEHPFRLRLLDACSHAKDPEEMISLLPEVQRYVEENHAALSATPEEFPNGSSVRCVQHSNPTWCYLHFYNGKRPQSFLDFVPEFAAEILQVIDFAEKQFGSKVVFTVSWLNDLPRFLRFFPDEWRENMGPAPDRKFVIPTNGCQGQFYNAAGWLNRRTADFYLENGFLKYSRRESHCDLKNLRKKKKNLL